MEISVIASGSNGNCYLIEDKDTSIMIDSGKSIKEIESRAKKIGKNIEEVDGIILSHAHIDHHLSVDGISRRYNIPLYVTKESQNQLNLRSNKIKRFSLDSDFKIKNLNIKPIKTSHDVPSCGFVINKFGLFTDTGIVTDHMSSVIENLSGILIEFNHDIDMLIHGRYPAYLKQRVFSDIGHLSNIDSSKFLQEKGKNLSLALLGHVSENNNKNSIIKKTFESIVKRKIDYKILSRDKESGTWKL